LSSISTARDDIVQSPDWATKTADPPTFSCNILLESVRLVLLAVVWLSLATTMPFWQMIPTINVTFVFRFGGLCK
jgi:hypothetical protein